MKRTKLTNCWSAALPANNLLLAAALLLAACQQGDSELGAEGEPVAFRAQRQAFTAADGMAQIYFTLPGTVRDGGEDPLLDDALAEALDRAEVSIDVCFYEFDRVEVIEALTRAVERGVEVRFVGDGDEVEDEGYLHLETLGVEMSLRRPRDRIMHNKFAIIDGRWLWTGSTNLTDNGIMRNNNNALLVDSPELAAIYELEFEQMFTDQDFGRHKVEIPGERTAEVGGRTIDVGFSPRSYSDRLIMENLATADAFVFFYIFSFTHAGFADELIALHESGVNVVGIFDLSQSRGRSSVDEYLAANGVPVFIDGNANAIGFAGGKLHDKVMLIDAGTDSDPVVLTGSYNWSGSGTNYNDENVLALHGDDFAAAYLEEFCSLLEVATPHPDAVGEFQNPCEALLTSVRINEIMANPDGSDTGREWVELVNTGPGRVNLDGWTIGDIVSPQRHVFGPIVLGHHESIVVAAGPFAEHPDWAVATTGALSLNNNAEQIVLANGDGVAVDIVSYRSAVSGVSFNRSLDGGDVEDLVLHRELEGTSGDSSPGTRIDGTPWGVIEPPEELVLINELLANPVGTDRCSEFVELVNIGEAAADLGGWQLGDTVRQDRHVFERGTMLETGAAIVVYDCGDHTGIPGWLASTSGGLGMNNTEDMMSLVRDDGSVADSVRYDDVDEGVSLNRATDAEAESEMVQHDSLGGGLETSPGTRSDGSAW